MARSHHEAEGTARQLVQRVSAPVALAIAILRPALRGGVDGANTHVTHTELREELAHAFELAGQRDSATFHYRAVERAWRHADPQFRERYELAKAKAGLR